MAAFTGDDPVDLINAFCIRNPSDAVLDRRADRELPRPRILPQATPGRSSLPFAPDRRAIWLRHCLYPAHLATLNLAAREINDEANYPRVVRCNFFDFELARHSVRFPTTRQPRPRDAACLDAVSATRLRPPREGREAGQGPLRSDLQRRMPDLRLTGRSDLHCYFWPAATRLLKPEATSAS